MILKQILINQKLHLNGLVFSWLPTCDTPVHIVRGVALPSSNHLIQLPVYTYPAYVKQIQGWPSFLTMHTIRFVLCLLLFISWQREMRKFWSSHSIKGFFPQYYKTLLNCDMVRYNNKVVCGLARWFQDISLFCSTFVISAIYGDYHVVSPPMCFNVIQCRFSELCKSVSVY